MKAFGHFTIDHLSMKVFIGVFLALTIFENVNFAAGSRYPNEENFFQVV